MHVTPKPRKLLVLDLDETLIHATEGHKHPSCGQ